MPRSKAWFARHVIVTPDSSAGYDGNCAQGAHRNQIHKVVEVREECNQSCNHRRIVGSVCVKASTAYRLPLAGIIQSNH